MDPRSSRDVMERKKNPLLLPGIIDKFLSRPAHSTVALLTELLCDINSVSPENVIHVLPPKMNLHGGT